MRIVYLHQYYSTAIGGTRSYEMARRLVALGHEVHIVTSDTGPVPGRAPGWHATTESGIQVHSLPVPYSNWMGYGARIRAFLRFAWAASWKAASLGGDVVYATSTPLTIALPAIYAARKNRIPMVFEVRDLWPEAPIALGVLKSKATIAAARWLERVAYRHAAHVVALSPTMRAGIVATGYPQDRVTVVPNGCDDSVFDIGPEPGRSIRQQHAWLGDRPLVVYTGAVGRVNGVLYLARVASEARRADPELRFVVIGDGRETDVVREAAEQLGVLGQNFFMLPPVPKSEVARWLSAADIATSLVVDVPALWANSANKVFDAFAAGKPVAINYEGWQADLLREAGAGLILSARDHASAATTLIRTVRDSEWLVRAGHAARKLAQGRFNRDRLVAQVDDVLRHVVNGKRSSTTSAPTGTTATQPPEPPTVAPPTSAGPRIYLSPPHLSGSEQRHVAEAFASNWITSSGPQIEAFEQEFSSVIGGLPAVALSSGTAALHLGLRLAGVGPGDEVLVSTLTFVASVNPILYLGATPVFVDSERISWNMDPALLAEAIEASVRRRGRPPKAVIVVHLYGQSADLDAVREICNRHEIALIEDAAEALGATYKGRPPGTFGRVGIYSFNGNKIITTSGGGMLVSPDPALVAHARRLATQAREPAPHYEHREMGYNYRLSNILAGIGRSQLAVLAERVAARRRNFAWYVDALGGLPGVDFMPEAPWGTHSRWLTCLTIDPSKFGADREAVRLALEAENIEARPVWKPMHLQPVFAGHLRCGGSVAEDLFTRGLCLPSGSSLTLPDLARVAEIIQRTHRTRHE